MRLSSDERVISVACSIISGTAFLLLAEYYGGRAASTAMALCLITLFYRLLLPLLLPSNNRARNNSQKTQRLHHDDLLFSSQVCPDWSNNTVPSGGRRGPDTRVLLQKKSVDLETLARKSSEKLETIQNQLNKVDLDRKNLLQRQQKMQEIQKRVLVERERKERLDAIKKEDARQLRALAIEQAERRRKLAQASQRKLLEKSTGTLEKATNDENSEADDRSATASQRKSLEKSTGNLENATNDENSEADDRSAKAESYTATDYMTSERSLNSRAGASREEELANQVTEMSLKLQQMEEEVANVKSSVQLASSQRQPAPSVSYMPPSTNSHLGQPPPARPPMPEAYHEDEESSGCCGGKKKRRASRRMYPPIEPTEQSMPQDEEPPFRAPQRHLPPVDEEDEDEWNHEKGLVDPRLIVKESAANLRSGSRDQLPGDLMDAIILMLAEHTRRFRVLTSHEAKAWSSASPPPPLKTNRPVVFLYSVMGNYTAVELTFGEPPVVNVRDPDWRGDVSKEFLRTVDHMLGESELTTVVVQPTQQQEGRRRNSGPICVAILIELIAGDYNHTKSNFEENKIRPWMRDTILEGNLTLPPQVTGIARLLPPSPIKLNIRKNKD